MPGVARLDSGAGRGLVGSRAVRALLEGLLALSIGLVSLSCGSEPRLEAWVFISNTDSKTVTIFDSRSWKAVGTVGLPGSPHGIDVEPAAKRVWSSNLQGDSVTLIDVATRKVERTIPVCRGPVQVAFAGSRAFVACGDGLLDVIDTSTLTRIAREPIGFAPHAIMKGPGGRLWSANRGSNDVSEIDAGTGKLIARHPAAPFAYGLAFSPDGKYGYVSSRKWNSVVVLSMEDLQILGSIPVGTEPALVVAAPDGKRLFVSNRKDGTISVINALTFKVLRTIETGREPDGLTLSRDGRLLFVANVSSDSVSVLDTRSYRVLRTLPSGKGPSDVELVPIGA